MRRKHISDLDSKALIPNDMKSTQRKGPVPLSISSINWIYPTPYHKRSYFLIDFLKDYICQEHYCMDAIFSWVPLTKQKLSFLVAQFVSRIIRYRFYNHPTRF